jgi:hypothetical protein
MAAIIYWVPILFLIALAAFSRAQSRVRVEYSIARAFTGCAAVVAAGRTRADGGGARQADRGRRESCVFYADFATYLSHWFAAQRAPARRVEVELTPCCLRLSGGPIFVIAIMPPR